LPDEKLVEPAAKPGTGGSKIVGKLSVRAPPPTTPNDNVCDSANEAITVIKRTVR
jgi:hypothetical protein